MLPSSMRTMRRSSAPTYNLAYVKCAIGHYFRLGGAPAQPARPHWQRLQCQFVSTFLTQRRAYSISCTHFKDISKASMAAPIVEPVAFPPYAIDRAMYTEQRQRLAASMEVKFPGQAVAAIFRGETEIAQGSGDETYPFRQDSYFEYLFGYERADCIGCVLREKGLSLLFIPYLSLDYEIVFGHLATLEEVRAQTQVDEVHYAKDIVQVLRAKGVTKLLQMNGVNSDSGLTTPAATFEGIKDFASDESGWLFEVLAMQRSLKTEREVDLLKYASRVSSLAHVETMKRCRPGLSQHQIEAIFQYHIYNDGGCKRTAYGNICASGADCAVLHYPYNDKIIHDGAMMLLDMGAEYFCYASDITNSFPANGKFTPVQKVIYEAVLDAQQSVIHAVKPGVSWADMHRLAQRVMARHLIAAGIMKGTVEEIEAHDLMFTFQPHGLGHLMGLDTHDVAGYLPGMPPRPKERFGKKLRTSRILEPRMVITVEPGLYFNTVLLEKAFADPVAKPFFNEALIREKYWQFGGVRIEDNIVITSNGCLDMTCIPRTCEDIEAVMSGAKKWTWQPKVVTNIHCV